MRSIKPHLLLCFILIPLFVYSQEVEGGQYRNSLDDAFKFNLRGKVFTFFIIEDAYFVTGTLGGELIYNKRHSLGVDVTYFRWRNEEDDMDDNPMYENYDRRMYWYFDYKLKLFDIKGGRQLYFNLYDKIGTDKVWYTPQDYDLSMADSIKLKNKSNGSFNEPGIGIGFKRCSEGDRLGWDISANIGRRFSVDDITTYTSYTSSVFEPNVKEDHYLFYMRLNLFYRLGKD